MLLFCSKYKGIATHGRVEVAVKILTGKSLSTRFRTLKVTELFSGMAAFSLSGIQHQTNRQVHYLNDVRGMRGLWTRKGKETVSHRTSRGLLEGIVNHYIGHGMKDCGLVVDGLRLCLWVWCPQGSRPSSVSLPQLLPWGCIDFPLSFILLLFKALSWLQWMIVALLHLL